jgi:hypothetical protein
MNFKQWWDGHKWSFSMRVLVKPLATPFAEIAWDAAVQVEREACAKVCEKFGYDHHHGVITDQAAAAIRARGQA